MSFFMRAIGFLGGPICVALLGFYFLEELGGAYFAFFFVAPATAIFLPIFMLGASIVGPHIIRLLFLANSVPLGFLFLTGRADFLRQLELFHSIPFLAASFCAIFYWVFAAAGGEPPEMPPNVPEKDDTMHFRH